MDALQDLFAAIKQRDADDVREIASNHPELLACTDEDGITPLVDAATTYDANVIGALLEAGADVNFQLDDGCTVLHTILGDWCSEKSLPIIRLLIAAGADLTLRDSMGLTPLLYAIVHGRPNQVQVLLELGANPNDILPVENRFEDGSLCFALDLAVVNPDSETILHSLLSAGANPRILDENGNDFFARIKAEQARYEPGEFTDELTRHAEIVRQWAESRSSESDQ